MVKKRLIDLLSDSKKYIGYNIFVQWINLISQIIAVFVITNFIEKTLKDNIEIYDIVFVISIFFIVVITRIICEKLLAEFSYLASRDVKRVLREKIYDKLLRLGASYNEKVSTSEVVQMTTEGVEQLEIYFGRYLPQLFYSLLAPITLFIILSFFSLKASLILLLCVPLIPISIVCVQKIAID